MKRSRFLVAGFALLALVLVAVLALSAPSKYSRRSQRLPDGSVLNVVSISYGTNHVYTLPAHTPWKDYLAEHLPRWFTARLGWWGYGGSVGLSARPGETSLAIFTVCDLAKQSSFSASPKVVLLDDRGATFDSASEGAVCGGSDGKHDWRLVGWQFSNVPRDSKWLQLQFTEQSPDGTQREPVAKFLVPNPLTQSANE